MVVRARFIWEQNTTLIGTKSSRFPASSAPCMPTSLYPPPHVNRFPLFHRLVPTHYNKDLLTLGKCQSVQRSATAPSAGRVCGSRRSGRAARGSESQSWSEPDGRVQLPSLSLAPAQTNSRRTCSCAYPNAPRAFAAADSAARTHAESCSTRHRGSRTTGRLAGVSAAREGTYTRPRQP